MFTGIVQGMATLVAINKKELFQTHTIELTDEMIIILQKLQNLIASENTNASWAVGSKWEGYVLKCCLSNPRFNHE